MSWQQLVDAAVHRHTIQDWLEGGRLHRVHHGVYAVGHVAANVHADYMAAVLACGCGAVLSHRPAAWLLRLLSGDAPAPEVTVPTTAGRRRPGIVVHRVRTIDSLDVSTFERIPITIVPRVLLDLAMTTSAPELARACHQSWVHHRTTPHQVEACIARNQRKPGAARLRRALGADVTLSELEDRFLALLVEHRLPLPRTNIDRGGDKVDCHWPHQDLTVELLSYRFHASRQAFESDLARRRRSNHLAYAWGDVCERGSATIAELRVRLERGIEPSASGVPRRSPPAGATPRRGR